MFRGQGFKYLTGDSVPVVLTFNELEPAERKLVYEVVHESMQRGYEGSLPEFDFRKRYYLS